MCNTADVKITLHKHEREIKLKRSRSCTIMQLRDVVMPVVVQIVISSVHMTRCFVPNLALELIGTWLLGT